MPVIITDTFDYNDIRADGKIQPQPSMAVEKVSMDEGDIENTTAGNKSVWSLAKT